VGAEARVRLTLQGSQFRRELARARRDVERFRRTVNSEIRRATLTLGAMTAGATLVGATFEQAMANVASIAGATRKEMEALEAAARRMGATTTFSAQQAAEAEYALVSAGLAVKETIAALPGVMVLAGATQADLGSTAETVTATLAQFRLEAEQTNRVVNTFVAAIAASPLTLDRLSEAMAMSGSAAAALQISLEETVAAIGLLHKAGLKGSQAGTYLRSVLLNLNEAASQGKGAIGAALQEWDSASEGLIGAIKRLEAAGVTGRVALAELGTKGGPALAALLDQGSAALAGMTRKITGTDKAFDAFRIQMDTTESRWKILTSTLQEAALRIWSVIKGPINNVIREVTTAVQRNFDNIQEAFAGLVSIVEQVAGIIGRVISFVSKHKTSFEALAASIGLVATAIYGVATAQAAWNAVAALNPITGILMGITLAIAIVIRKMGGLSEAWTKTRRFGQKALIELQTGARKVWAALGLVADVVVAIGKTFAQSIGAAWRIMREFAEFVIESWTRVGELILHPWRAGEIVDELKEGLAEAVDAMASVLQSAEVKEIWSGITDAYHQEMEQIRRDHAAALAQMEAETQRALEEAREATGGAGASQQASEALKLQEEAQSASLTIREARYEAHAERIREITDELASDTVEVIALTGTEVGRIYRQIAGYATAAYAKVVEEARKATSLERVMKLQLLKATIQGFREEAAARIEAKGHEAAMLAAFEAAEALAALGRYDFAAAAKHGLAAAKFAALSGGAAVAAAMVRGLGGGGEAAPAGGPEEGGVASRAAAAGGTPYRDVSARVRQMPETINFNLQFVHQGGAVYGEGGLQEMIEEEVIPRLREALANAEI
jgi:TP901 family phage tail tape measure protein